MLEEPDIPPSRIYKYLSPYSLNAILSNLISCDSQLVRQRMELYLNKLRHIQPSLSGEDLINSGIPAGHRIKEILGAILESRLDGRVSSTAEELEMVDKIGKVIK